MPASVVMLVALVLPGSIALAALASGDRSVGVSELALSPASFDAGCLGVVARALAASVEPVSLEAPCCASPETGALAGGQLAGSVAAAVLIRELALPPPGLV